MNCRQIQDHLFADRDETSVSAAAAREVADHLASCPECRSLQEGLTKSLHDWQREVGDVPIPDPQTEWHAVRRKIRQGEGAATPAAAWAGLLRIAAPLTAVAAIALVVWQARPPALGPTPVEPATTVAQTDSFDGTWPEMDQHFAFTAHAEYVETDNEDASPFVYVDDESGWLIVWASDPPDEASI